MPERSAPPGFKERLLERARTEVASDARRPAPMVGPARATSTSAERTVRRSTPLGGAGVWPLAAAAALVLMVVTGFGIWQQVSTDRVIAATVLQGDHAQGTARVLVYRSGAAVLELENLGDPPAGHVYEAWIIPPDSNPVPAGVSRSGTATLTLDEPVLDTTVAITVEPEPGTAQPTSSPILAGTPSV